MFGAAPQASPFQSTPSPVPALLSSLTAPKPGPMSVYDPKTAYNPPPAPAPAPVNPSASPIFTPSSAGPSAAPVGPPGATGAAPASQSPIDPRYLRADGSIKSPDEIAAEIGGTLAAAHGNGDVGTLAGQQFGPGPATTVEAEAQARHIGNTRNDIAVGETDPYHVGSKSGIAYTPAELNAIEKGYAGIYDPALDTALAKVNQKQAEDKIKLQADLDAKAKANEGFTLGKDDVRYDAQGNPIAVGLPSSTTGAAGGVYTKGSNPVIDAYVEGVKNQTVKLTDVPDAYKDLVVQGIGGGGKFTLSKSANDALSNIESLLNNPQALEDVTGGSNLNPLTLLPGAKEAPARNLLNQLAGTLAIQNRQQLHGQGAISDFEFRVLQQAASDLGVSTNGTSNLSAADLKKGLQKLQLRLQVGDVGLTDDKIMYLASPKFQEDTGQPPMTPDEIREYAQDQGFSSAGNASDSKVSLNRPQRNNNPGNVKTGGLADSLAVGVDEQGHLKFPTPQAGFQALTLDLTAKINGGSSHLPSNPTIAQLGKVYAEDPNWPVKVAKILGVTPDTHTQMVPLANLVKAVATQEGFYA